MHALKARRDYFDVGAGKITGMDWNLWNEYAMTPDEAWGVLHERYPDDPRFLHLPGRKRSGGRRNDRRSNRAAGQRR